MTNRKSNIELLRIIAMLMIIAHHLTAKGLLGQDALGISIWEDGNLVNKIVSALFINGGTVGNSVFFIITGYFLCINKEIRLKKLIFTSLFYGFFSIIIYCITKFCFAVDYKEINVAFFSVESFLKPVSGGIWWFVSAYALLIIIHPILNELLAKLNKRGTLILQGALLFMFTTGLFFGGAYNNIEFSVWMYVVGSYIRKYVDIDKMMKKRVLLSILIFLMWCLSTIGLIVYDIKYFENCSYLLSYGIRMIYFFSDVIINRIIAILLFVLFLSIEVNNKLINKMAGFTLGVYMIHESPAVKYILWRKILRIDYVYYTDFFPVYACFVILVIYMLGCLIDFVRQSIFAPKMEKIFDIAMMKLGK